MCFDSCFWRSTTKLACLSMILFIYHTFFQMLIWSIVWWINKSLSQNVISFLDRSSEYWWTSKSKIKNSFGVFTSLINECIGSKCNWFCLLLIYFHKLSKLFCLMTNLFKSTFSILIIKIHIELQSKNPVPVQNSSAIRLKLGSFL